MDRNEAAVGVGCDGCETMGTCPLDKLARRVTFFLVVPSLLLLMRFAELLKFSCCGLTFD